MTHLGATRFSGAAPMPVPSTPRRGNPTAAAARLRSLAHVDLSDAQAAGLWRSVQRHRRRMREALGRDVGQRVALLDYLLNIQPHFVAPTIIESATLEAIEREAISDGLTGLYNRNYFETALWREAAQSRITGQSLSLVLLDLDGFKAINDGAGHWVGDRALEIVAHLIRKHIRSMDLACRYGGDEFALLLPDTHPLLASQVAERIRSDVETTFQTRSVCGRQVTLTTSIGIATLPADSSAPELLFTSADSALYGAKHLGANRVVISPSFEPRSQDVA